MEVIKTDELGRKTIRTEYILIGGENCHYFFCGNLIGEHFIEVVINHVSGSAAANRFCSLPCIAKDIDFNLNHTHRKGEWNRFTNLQHKEN